MPFEDAQKVQDFLARLTEIHGGTWQALSEVFSYTSVTGDWNNVTFNPGRGYLVKLFVNTATGEVKAFPLSLFKPDQS